VVNINNESGQFFISFFVSFPERISGLD